MKAEARQRQILECAKRVFAERGFHKANISHICAEAKIGRGTLYQYFKNKKSVFEAILRQTLDRVHAQMQAQRPVKFVPPGRIPRSEAIRWSARRLHSLLSAVFEDQDTLRILLREAVGLDVDIEGILGEIDDALITTVETDLRAWQEAGWVRPLNARVTATLMVGAVEKLGLVALRAEEPVDLMALANEIAHLHGIGVLSERVRDQREDEAVLDPKRKTEPER